MRRPQRMRAARLLSAAANPRASTGAGRRLYELATFEPMVAALRATMGDAAFEAAWAEGQALTLEQAVDLALDAPPT
jgi:hypothetical protein